MIGTEDDKNACTIIRSSLCTRGNAIMKLYKDRSEKDY